jgi:D-beta-D-heptose 7-phosphate kinase / D-beta-D-heptose 1-phosphate adenosyltransferase
VLSGRHGERHVSQGVETRFGVSQSEKWLDAFGRTRVLVVGDLMLDDYRRGHVERISPEAPVPILGIVGREAALGGAGNVVRNLRSLGANVAVAGVIGDDDTGNRIIQELTSLGVDSRGVIKDPQRVSTRKIRFVSIEHGQQVFRADEESTQPVHGHVQAEVVRSIREKVRDAQIVLCSDYLKGVLNASVLTACFQAGRERKIPVLVAPKDSNPQKYSGATMLMPNLKELARLVGAQANGPEWLTQAAETLMTGHALEALVVTRGSEGMSLFETVGGKLRRMDIPTVARNVYDVTGAGDTAISAFAVAIAAGAERETAVRLANAAAGIVVGKHGTASVTVEELREYLADREPQAIGGSNSSKDAFASHRLHESRKA